MFDIGYTSRGFELFISYPAIIIISIFALIGIIVIRFKDSKESRR